MTIALLGPGGILGTSISKIAETNQVAVHPIQRPESSDFSDIWREILRKLIELEIGTGDAIINASGVTKKKASENTSLTVFTNSLLPHLLSQYCQETGALLVSPATDCVFSGRHGGYVEDSIQDPIDDYGSTKSLGEVSSGNSITIRASFVGPEQNTSFGLWQWVVGHPAGSEITGYGDQVWNGVHVDCLASLLLTHANSPDVAPRGVFHLVPDYVISKLQLVSDIAVLAGRTDLRVIHALSHQRLDRSLKTNFPEVNRQFWEVLQKAGYAGGSFFETARFEGWSD